MRHLTLLTEALLFWSAILAVIMSVLLITTGPLKLIRMTFFLLLIVVASAVLLMYQDLHWFVPGISDR